MIRFLYGIAHVLWKSHLEKAARNLEECPAFMSPNEVLYLGYKYYYREPNYSDEISAHFNAQRAVIAARNQVIPGADPLLSFSVGGDLMPYRKLKNIHPAEFWKETGDWFFGSDIVFANLETPLDLSRPASDVPEVMLNDMYFNADSSYFELFNGGNHFGKGFSVLSVANNHTMDQGEQGLRQTLSFLRDRGIAAVGASEFDQDPFWMTTCKGVKISFHAFTFSLNKCSKPQKDDLHVNYLRLNLPDADIRPVVEEIEVARSLGSEFPVVYLHMGNAYTAYPSDHIRNNLRRLANESNAPLILCGHGHNVQPAEWMGDTLVFHSLGDFVGYDIYKGCRFPLMLRFQLYRLTDGTLSFRFEPRMAYLTEDNSACIRMRFRGNEQGMLPIENSALRSWYLQHIESFNFLP